MTRLLLLLVLLPVTIYAAATLTQKDVVDKSVAAIETTLTDEDFVEHPAVNTEHLGLKVKDDPTMGNKLEGDIAMESMDHLKDFLKDSNKLGRNAIRQAYRRWPNNEIPYTLSSQYGSYARSVIAKAMKEYHDKTCVRFVPRNAAKHNDYVYIHPDDGCYSLVGRTGGRQPLSLDSGCIQVGTIVHELMHSVGFFHEQSRADRDDYLEIVWRNVMNGADDQFEKYTLNVIDHLNEPYDYASIMHYGPYAFSGNGKKTIQARKGGAERMGQRTAFSDTDIRKINKLYQCNINNNNNNKNQINGNSIVDSNKALVTKRPATVDQQARVRPSMRMVGIYSNHSGRVRIIG